MTPNPTAHRQRDPVANPGVDAIDSGHGLPRLHWDRDRDPGLESATVPGSLLGKAKMAQDVFDSKFLLPFAPDRPDFFLVPGDNQVTVLWRPSADRDQGDPFFAIARRPDRHRRARCTIPNYRQFDVEGYRIYRGRVDTPNELELIAQFDYDRPRGSYDFRGTVNPDRDLRARSWASLTGCAGPFPTTPPCRRPARSSDSVSVDLVGPDHPGRPRAAASRWPTARRRSSRPNAVDTAGHRRQHRLPGAGQHRACRSPTPTTACRSVVDHDVRNNLRYFYSVTAFDVNSFVSGPVQPRVAAGDQGGDPGAGRPRTQRPRPTLTPGVVGRDVALDRQHACRRSTRRPASSADRSRRPTAATWVRWATSRPGHLRRPAQVAAHAGQPRRWAIGIRRWLPRTVFLRLPRRWTVRRTEFGQSGDRSRRGRRRCRQSPAPFPATSPTRPWRAKFGGSGAFNAHRRTGQPLPGTNYQRSRLRPWLRRTTRPASAPGRTATTTAPAGSMARRRHERDGGRPERRQRPSNSSGGRLRRRTSTTRARSRAWPRSTQAAAYLRPSTARGGAWTAPGRRGRGRRTSTSTGARPAWSTPSSTSPTTSRCRSMPDSVGAGFGHPQRSRPRAAAGIGRRPPDGRHASTTWAASSRWRLGAAGAGLNGRAPRAARPTPYTLQRRRRADQVAIYTGATGRRRDRRAAARPGLHASTSPGHIFMLRADRRRAAGRGHGVDPAAATSARSPAATATRAADSGTYTFTPATRPFTAVGAELRIEFDVTNQLPWRATKDDLSQVHTVPDPYYVTSAFETRPRTKIIKFVNLPADGDHPDLLVERRAGADAGAQLRASATRDAAFGGAERPGTCGTATTRSSPAGCTSITSKPATPGGSAGSPS